MFAIPQCPCVLLGFCGLPLVLLGLQKLLPHLNLWCWDSLDTLACGCGGILGYCIGSVGLVIGSWPGKH